MIRYAALARVFQENTPSTISKNRSGHAVLVATPAFGWPNRVGGRGLCHQPNHYGGTSYAAMARGCSKRADGDSAVARAAEPGLDLILMDIQMPGKDGIAAIREIRALPALDRLPILGFTASADKPTHQRILAAGADGVLTKPLGEVDLIRAVRRATRRHRLTPAIRRDEPGSDD
ncbi:MAG: response regulator [Candidatus Competibacteraceae bacterium]